MALKFLKHPGREYVHVECDVCHGKFYQKDVVKVNDPYNYQHGMVVCKADLDQTNDQTKPNRIVEKPISNPELLRPQRGPVYESNVNDDRLPGAPRLGRAQVNPINDTIDLFWMGPEDQGSSNITGYVIERASPQLSFYEVLSSNTGSPSTYYQDLTGSVSSQYSYKVAAINGFGQGPFSSEFFWPVLEVDWADILYLTTGADEVLLLSDTLEPIRLNH